MITIKKRHEITFGDDVKVFVRGLTAAEYIDFLQTIKAPVVPLAKAIANATDADATDTDAVAAEIVSVLPAKLQPDTMRCILKGVVGGEGFAYEEYDADGNITAVAVPSADITGDFLMDNTPFNLTNDVLNEIMALTNLSQEEKKT